MNQLFSQFLLSQVLDFASRSVLSPHLHATYTRGSKFCIQSSLAEGVVIQFLEARYKPMEHQNLFNDAKVSTFMY